MGIPIDFSWLKKNYQEEFTPNENSEKIAT